MVKEDELELNVTFRGRFITLSTRDATFPRVYVAPGCPLSVGVARGKYGDEQGEYVVERLVVVFSLNGVYFDARGCVLLTALEELSKKMDEHQSWFTPSIMRSSLHADLLVPFEPVKPDVSFAEDDTKEEL